MVNIIPVNNFSWNVSPEVSSPFSLYHVTVSYIDETIKYKPILKIRDSYFLFHGAKSETTKSILANLCKQVRNHT